MSSSLFQKVLIEIEKHSNQKYEMDHALGKLVLDRVLPYPYFYPYSYGYIPGTRAGDGDEIDILVVSDKSYPSGAEMESFIIGALEMTDEKGEDIKLLVVSKEDYESCMIRDITDLDKTILENIHWFFSNYKSKEKNKWAKIGDFLNREKALVYYNASCLTA